MNARDRDVSTETRTPVDAEGPLRRWARRRREVAREAQADAEARARDISEQAPDIRQSVGDSLDPAAVEEKALTDEDMPPLDSLGEDSDYSDFLSPGVSEALRRRALRKLFSSAVFNIPDGLDDYDDDFTSFAALGDIVTSDMKHQAEVEAERAKQAQSSTEPASEIEDGSSPVEDERLAHADEEAPDRAEGKPSGETAPGELPAPAQSVPPRTVARDATPSRVEAKPADETDSGELSAPAHSLAPQGVAGDVQPGRTEAKPARETESEELSAPPEPVALQAATGDEASSRPDDKPAGETGPDEALAPAHAVSSQSVAYEDDETSAGAGHPSGGRT